MRIPRSLAAVLLVLTLTAPPGAHAQHAVPGGMLGSDEKLRFPEGRDSVEIPFENQGEHLMIPVAVNGRPPLTMVFDTGMPVPGVLLYDGAGVDSMKLAFSPMQVGVGGAGGGERIQARLATGVSLGVGELTVDGSVALVMPAHPQMSGLHDGIIGASLFDSLVMRVDHDRGRMTLYRRGAFTPRPGATEVPLEVVGRIAYVKAGVVGADGRVTPVRLVVDMGAAHAVSLNRHSGAGLTLPAGAIEARVGRGMSGVMTGSVGRLAGFELGGHRLPGVVATFPDSAFENPRGLDSRDGNLGGGVLGRFNVTFDYAGRRMFLEPNHRFAEPYEWDMTGVQFDIDKSGAIEAVAVREASPGAAAGVQPGDRLVAVDGRPARPRDLSRLRDGFRKEGREVEMTLARDGRERKVRLKLRRLL